MKYTILIFLAVLGTISLSGCKAKADNKIIGQLCDPGSMFCENNNYFCCLHQDGSYRCEDTGFCDGDPDDSKPLDKDINISDEDKDVTELNDYDVPPYSGYGTPCYPEEGYCNGGKYASGDYICCPAGEGYYCMSYTDAPETCSENYPHIDIPDDPGEQQYAIALAETGRNSDFTVSDPAGNGQTIVTDRATGLIWQQKTPGQALIWQKAVKYCEELSYAGSDNWHLPTPHEFAAIFDYQKSTYYDVFDIYGNSFWTSLKTPNSSVWTFDSGVIVEEGYSQFSYHDLPAWCVRRDGVLSFSDTRVEEKSNSDGKITIIDNMTKREWTSESVSNNMLMNWNDSKDLCDSLVYGDKDDWRLPTVNEFRGIIDFKKSWPSSNFPIISLLKDHDIFWTSSGDKYIWWVNFKGMVYAADPITSGLNTICIRSTQ